jgi:hypothetical protein
MHGGFGGGGGHGGHGGGHGGHGGYGGHHGGYTGGGHHGGQGVHLGAIFGHLFGGGHHGGHGVHGAHPDQNATWSQAMQAEKAQARYDGPYLSQGFLIGLLYLGLASWLVVIYFVSHAEHKPIVRGDKWNQYLTGSRTDSPSAQAEQLIVPSSPKASLSQPQANPFPVATNQEGNRAPSYINDSAFGSPRKDPSLPPQSTGFINTNVLPLDQTVPSRTAYASPKVAAPSAAANQYLNTSNPQAYGSTASGASYTMPYRRQPTPMQGLNYTHAGSRFRVITTR